MRILKKWVFCFVCFICLWLFASSHPLQKTLVSGTHKHEIHDTVRVKGGSNEGRRNQPEHGRKFTRGGVSGGEHGGGSATPHENGGGDGGGYGSGGAAVIPVIVGGAAANGHHQRNIHHNSATCRRNFLQTPTLILMTLASVIVHLYVTVGC